MEKRDGIYLPASYFQEGLPLWEEVAALLLVSEEGWVHLLPSQRGSGPTALTVWSSPFDPGVSCTTTK